MTTHLHDLANQIHPDSLFVGELEERLMHMNMPMTEALPRRYPARRWLAAALLLIALTAAIMTVPPLRTLAQEILTALFTHAGSDTEVITFGEMDMNRIQPYSDIADLSELNRRVGFNILVPDYLPEGFTLDVLNHYSPDPSISLSYTASGMMLFINQSNFDFDTSFEVGASANIVPITIDRAGQQFNGEYVQGNWVFSRDQGDPPLVAGQAFSSEGDWRSDIPMRWLVWKEGGISYQITTSRKDDKDLSLLPTMEDLERVAESMR